MKVEEIFGNNLKRLRVKNNFTQEELSDALGITTSHLSELERSVSFTSAGLLNKICDCLNVKPYELFMSSSIESKDEKGFILEVDDMISSFKDDLKDFLITFFANQRDRK